MYKSFTVWRNPTKIERIFRILANYACEIDSRIKFNGFLESTKHWILQGKTFFNIFVKIKKCNTFDKNTIKHILIFYFNF